MYSLCLRYAKNREDANDIFQQAFYLVFKNLGQLKNANALSGWVKSIFVNAALDHKRKNGHTSSLSVEEVSPTKDSYSLNEAMSNLGTDELTTLIQQLPEGYRKVFNMYIIDGYSHKEIAEKLSISLGTSKSQLHCAREMLKRKIAESLTVANGTTAR